jgi:hypothetical protein
MEPSCTNLSLPRFASNRHGFESAIQQGQISNGLVSTTDYSGYRRERAAVYGKLLKLRDTDGIQKQFQ